MVTKLDEDKATELVREVLVRNYPEGDFSRYKAQPMVVVNGTKGLSTVCTEGVGWNIDSNGMYTLMYFADFSQNSVDITREELLSCLSDEQVDLAQFIRNHNDRLQTNYEIWYYYGRNGSQDLTELQVT
jgi:hypothetical protein